MASTAMTGKIVLDTLLRNVAAPTIGPVYLALFTADPTDQASYANEVSGGAYARLPITFGDPLFTGSTANTNVISSAVATAGWGTVSHWAIVNTLTGTSGLMLVRAPLAVSQTIGIGDSFQGAVGDLVVTHS